MFILASKGLCSSLCLISFQSQVISSLDNLFYAAAQQRFFGYGARNIAKMVGSMFVGATNDRPGIQNDQKTCASVQSCS